MLMTMGQILKASKEMPHLKETSNGWILVSPEEIGKEEAERIRQFVRDWLDWCGKKVKNIDKLPS